MPPGVGWGTLPLLWGVGGAGQHLGRTAGVSPCHTAGGAGGVVALTQGLFWGEGCWWGLWKGLHKNEQGVGGNLMGKRLAQPVGVKPRVYGPTCTLLRGENNPSGVLLPCRPQGTPVSDRPVPGTGATALPLPGPIPAPLLGPRVQAGL